MLPVPLVIVSITWARVTPESAVGVKAEAEPPWRFVPWQTAQLAEYRAAASMAGAGVSAEAVFEAAELPAELKA